jgi:type I restriction-modification system DNA methylase subunit
MFGICHDGNTDHANNEKTMKNLLIIFTGVFVTGYIFTSANAKQSPTIDDIDALLNKVSKNIESASQATKMAQTMNAKLIELKVEEKKVLKKEVEQAEAKMEAMEQKIEVYAVKMVGNGIDTATEQIAFTGPIYEAWLNYVEEGGKEDFGYFRLYLWQQK